MTAMREALITELTRLEGAVDTFGRDREESFELYVNALERHGEYGLAAVRSWPQRAETWPPLRSLLDLARELADEVRATDAAQVMQKATPVGEFVRAIFRSEAGGAGYVASWLNDQANCRFLDERILTTKEGARRITSDFGVLAEKCKVQIRHDPACDEMLAIYLTDLKTASRKH